jgi:hypothetical protein
MITFTAQIKYVVMRIQKDFSGHHYGITQRISNMNMYLGFQSDIIDITRISSFPGYRAWMIRDIPGFNLDNCVG